MQAKIRHEPQYLRQHALNDYASYITRCETIAISLWNKLNLHLVKVNWAWLQKRDGNKQNTGKYCLPEN